MRSVIAGVMLLSWLAPAAQARELKIGVVNIQRAVSETKEGQAAEAELKKVKSKLENTLNRKLKEFYGKEKKLREAWAILKDAERRKRAAASRQQLEVLQKQYVSAEKELMQRKTKAMMKITQKLNKIIERLAKKQRFDYIFANAAVLWAPRHVDLTNEVIRAYDRGH